MRTLYFCPVVSSSIFLFSSPNLSGRYHTSTHGVALVKFRMQVWNMLHAARWKYRTPKWRKKTPSEHHRTTLSGYIFATEARIDNQKKNLLNSNISPTCAYNMANFGPLTVRSVRLFGCLGHPANFNGFRILAALLHSTLVLGVSLTLRRWIEGATCIRQGGHHVGHWPTF